MALRIPSNLVYSDGQLMHPPFEPPPKKESIQSPRVSPGRGGSTVIVNVRSVSKQVATNNSLHVSRDPMASTSRLDGSVFEGTGAGCDIHSSTIHDAHNSSSVNKGRVDGVSRQSKWRLWDSGTLPVSLDKSIEYSKPEDRGNSHCTAAESTSSATDSHYNAGTPEI